MMRHPHIYGIDLASTSELIAFHKSPSEIARLIGADEVIFQTLPDLIAACAELSPRDPATQQFEVGIFTGDYTTPIDDGYLEHLEQSRGGVQKRKAEAKARQTWINDFAAACGSPGLSSRINSTLRDIESDTSSMALPGRPKEAPLNPPTSPPADTKGLLDTQDIGLHNLNSTET